MKKFRTQLIIALILIIANLVYEAKAADDQEGQELQELERMAQDAPVFVSTPEEFGAVKVTASEDDWMKSEMSNQMSDEISTGAAAPVRDSTPVDSSLSKDENIEFVPSFPLAPEKKSVTRKRSR